MIKNYSIISHPRQGYLEMEPNIMVDCSSGPLWKFHPDDFDYL